MYDDAWWWCMIMYADVWSDSYGMMMMLIYYARWCMTMMYDDVWWQCNMVVMMMMYNDGVRWWCTMMYDADVRWWWWRCWWWWSTAMLAQADLGPGQRSRALPGRAVMAPRCAASPAAVPGGQPLGRPPGRGGPSSCNQLTALLPQLVSVQCALLQLVMRLAATGSSLVGGAPLWRSPSSTRSGGVLWGRPLASPGSRWGPPRVRRRRKRYAAVAQTGAEGACGWIQLGLGRPGPGACSLGSFASGASAAGRICRPAVASAFFCSSAAVRSRRLRNGAQWWEVPCGALPWRSPFAIPWVPPLAATRSPLWGPAEKK